MTKLFAGMFVLALTGCAPHLIVEKPGSTLESYRVDQYACEKDARQSGYVNAGIAGQMEMAEFYKTCLRSKGYSVRVAQPGEGGQQ